MSAKRIPGICQSCRKDFLGRKGAKFCSRGCFNEWIPGRINRGKKSEDHRRKIGDAVRGKLKGIPLSQNHRDNISMAKRGKPFSQEHRRALSIAAVRRLAAGGFGGRQTAYLSTKTGRVEHAHSSYELKRMKFLDNSEDVLSWTKVHGISIPYAFAGQSKQYIPDFLVEWRNGTKTLEEVKGWIREPDRVAAKEKAARSFSDRMGYRFLTLRNGDLEMACRD